MLKEINVHAGAVDVGSEYMHVAVYNGPTKVFTTMTSQLYEIAKFFKEQGVTTVVMEATGVYWLALYQVLEEAGLKVLVVNGAHVKNLPGARATCRIRNGSPSYTLMACCIRALFLLSPSAVCAIINACARTTFKWAAHIFCICKRRWIG